MNGHKSMSEAKGRESRNRFRITSIIIAVAIAFGAFGALIFTTNASATLFDGHAYSAALHIDGTSYGTQTNYQMLLTINKGVGTNSPGIVYLNNHALNWPFDIRFTKADSTTPLDFWRESYTTSVMFIWVELDTIAASPARTDLYVHYGKSAEADASNGTNTFQFFDDFPGVSLNAQWEVSQTVSVSGGSAHFTVGTNDASTESYLMSAAHFGPNKTFEIKMTPSDDKARVGLSVNRTTFGTGAWNMVGAQFYANYFWRNTNNGSAVPNTQQVSAPLYVATDQITSIEWTHENQVYLKNRTTQWIWNYEQVPSGADMHIYLRDIMVVDWVMLRNHQPIDPTWWEAGSADWEEFIGKMDFTRSDDNPLMTPTYAWEGINIGDFPIIEDTNDLKMYYSAFGFTENGGIALATSPKTYPATSWTKQGLVFTANETPGQWDSGCLRLGNVFKVGAVYYLYYHANSVFTPGPVWTGGTGDNAFGLATSTDGLTWTRNPSNPIFEHGGDESAIEDPVVIRVDATHWYMYYNYRAWDVLPGIRMATSPDGITWTRISVQNVLRTGGAGAWDSTYIEHTQIYAIAGHYVLVYEGFAGWPNGPWSIGLAYSDSPTGPFTKYSGNPIFSASGIPGAFDEFHVATPSLFTHSGIWYLFFQGGNVSASYGDSTWKMGMAYSDDPLSTYLHVGYNLVYASNDKSVDWSYGSAVSTISVMTNLDLTINLTAWNLTGNPIATWALDAPSGAVTTFTLSGLQAARAYDVFVDGVRFSSIVAVSGSISFAYSGPWSVHQFSVVIVSSSGGGAIPINVDFKYKVNGNNVSFYGSTAYTSSTLHYFWDFGDGNTSMLQNPTHIYAKLGTYEVILYLLTGPYTVVASAQHNVAILEMPVQGSPLGSLDMTGQIFVLTMLLISLALAVATKHPLPIIVAVIFLMLTLIFIVVPFLSLFGLVGLVI